MFTIHTDKTLFTPTLPTDFVANSTLLAEIEKNWLRIAPALLDYNYTVSQHQKDETSLKIKQFYMKGQPISRATTAPFIQVSLQILTSSVDNLSIHNEVFGFIELMAFCNLPVLQVASWNWNSTFFYWRHSMTIDV